MTRSSATYSEEELREFRRQREQRRAEWDALPKCGCSGGDFHCRGYYNCKRKACAGNCSPGWVHWDCPTHGPGGTHSIYGSVPSESVKPDTAKDAFIAAFKFWYDRDGSVGGLSQVVEDHGTVIDAAPSPSGVEEG